MMMIRSIAILGVSSGIAVAAGCGQVLSEEGRACPCSAGWTCCNNECVAGSSCCPKGVSLGTEMVPAAPDASDMAGTETVSGFAQGFLPMNQQVPFDYATSIWPQKDGFAFQGWLITASAQEAFTFTVWAAGDSGVQVPLPLITYGPLRNVGNGDQCSGSAEVAPMQPNPSGLAWTAELPGMYLVVPYHEVSVSSMGLAFQGFNDPRYTDAFLMMQEPAH